LSHGRPVEHWSNTRGKYWPAAASRHGRLPHLVMAALVASIHVFGAVGKDVDGRSKPGHDVQKAPVVNI
jgi:hypothetical protein